MSLESAHLEAFSWLTTWVSPKLFQKHQNTINFNFQKFFLKTENKDNTSQILSLIEDQTWWYKIEIHHSFLYKIQIIAFGTIIFYRRLN